MPVWDPLLQGKPGKQCCKDSNRRRSFPPKVLFFYNKMPFHCAIVIQMYFSNTFKNGLRAWSNTYLPRMYLRWRFCAGTMHLTPPPPQGLRLLSDLRWWFCCCWSIVLCTSHWLWGFCVCLWFVMLCFKIYVHSYHLEEEEKAICFAFIVLQMYCYRKCSVALPHGAMGWLAVCDCGISGSYSLAFW